MARVVAFLLLVFMGSVASAGPEVKITSFVSAGTRTKAAEVCGNVSGMNSGWIAVKVLVDHDGDRPGTYNTIADKSGKFCVAVVTFNGTAKAEVWSASSKALSAKTEPATLSLGINRDTE